MSGDERVVKGTSAWGDVLARGYKNLGTKEDLAARAALSTPWIFPPTVFRMARLNRRKWCKSDDDVKQQVSNAVSGMNSKQTGQGEARELPSGKKMSGSVRPSEMDRGVGAKAKKKRRPNMDAEENTVNDGGAVLFHYPFEGMVGADLGLTELADRDKGGLVRNSNRNSKKRIKITLGDVDRINKVGPDGDKMYWNDSLIDLWMVWMEGKRDMSQVHIFSPFFYTTLRDMKEGPGAVGGWTTNKRSGMNIDVFQQRLIFIPVNEGEHYSLCVVVNPGRIVEHKQLMSLGEGETGSEVLDQRFPCLLLFDSFDAHNLREVARRVRGWLNYEWEKLHKGDSGCFSEKSMIAAVPPVPKQVNGYDCAIYMCRYTYGVLNMVKRQKAGFTYKDAGVGKVSDEMHLLRGVFGNFMSESKQFDFDHRDIARMRAEMEKLVTNLHEKKRGVAVERVDG